LETASPLNCHRQTFLVTIHFRYRETETSLDWNAASLLYIYRTGKSFMTDPDFPMPLRDSRNKAQASDFKPARLLLCLPAG